MIDDRLRLNEQRLRRSQAIADEMRSRQSELRLELSRYKLRARTEPIQFAAYRRTGMRHTLRPVPDDIC
jgi:hypothetical protein